MAKIQTQQNRKIHRQQNGKCTDSKKANTQTTKLIIAEIHRTANTQTAKCAKIHRQQNGKYTDSKTANTQTTKRLNYTDNEMAKHRQ